MYLKHFSPLFIITLLLAGCLPATQSPYLTEKIEVNGSERTYHIHLPPNFDKEDPAPLVLALHGGGGQGDRFDQGTAGTLVAAADERGLVLVFPDGLNNQWCDGRLEHIVAERDCAAASDVEFFSALIDKMVRDYGIDPSRVYATGISNGGFMSLRLGLELSEKITAVAPVTAQLSLAIADQKPQQPVSVMIVNGTEDPIVPFDGGHIRLFSFGRSRGEILSTAETVTRFRRYNNCESAAELTTLPDNDPDDGTTIEIESFPACAGGTAVTLVRVIGGGHTWPGGQPYLNEDLVGRVSQEINASELILDFFLEHRR